jgi:hypothetical protein
MNAILQMRPLIPAPHPEVSRLERLLRRKTFEIEILQEALDAARIKYAMGSAPALNRAIQGAAEVRPLNSRRRNISTIHGIPERRPTP